jgi:hypothetical protein
MGKNRHIPLIRQILKNADMIEVPVGEDDCRWT